MRRPRSPRFRVARNVLCLGMAALLMAGPALAGGGQEEYGVPELDPAASVSALTILAGGLLLIADRVRFRRSRDHHRTS